LTTLFHFPHFWFLTQQFVVLLMCGSLHFLWPVRFGFFSGETVLIFLTHELQPAADFVHVDARHTWTVVGSFACCLFLDVHGSPTAARTKDKPTFVTLSSGWHYKRAAVITSKFCVSNQRGIQFFSAKLKSGCRIDLAVGRKPTFSTVFTYSATEFSCSFTREPEIIRG
jgi:hypothetical protein